MKTAVIVALILVAAVGYAGYSGVKNIRKLQEMGMQQVIDQGDAYLAERYPWTYGNVAGIRDWWYNP